MCKMAFMVSKKGHITGLDTVMFNTWGDYNPHGVGVLFRDKKNLFHLNRYEPTFAYRTVKHAYDRLLIHFRYSTGGTGTHPFNCSHAPNWYVIHNGVFRALGHFRKSLGSKGHEYKTGIDSENFAHIWGDIYNKDKNLGDLAKEMMNMSSMYDGTKNVILYNYSTDEWVIISDGNLSYVNTDDLFLVASNFDFLSSMKTTYLKEGHIIYGKGTEILGKTTWEGFYKLDIEDDCDDLDENDFDDLDEDDKCVTEVNEVWE